MKKLLTLAAAALLFTGMGMPLAAAETGTAGLKNGLTNGAKNGLRNGLKNGLAKGLKNGLKNGEKK